MPCNASWQIPFQTIKRDMKHLFTYVEHGETQIQQRIYKILIFLSWRQRRKKNPVCFVQLRARTMPSKVMQHLSSSEYDFKTWGHHKGDLLLCALSKNSHCVHLIMWYIVLRSYKNPHAIAEDLILSTAMVMVREVLDQSAADKINTIPLSNDTISWQIEGHLGHESSGHFALQMDASTRITKKAVLLVENLWSMAITAITKPSEIHTKH